jgi:hypothetical protein
METQMPRRLSKPSMKDPADSDFHRSDNKRGAKVTQHPKDDLRDPGDLEGDMPHDRGVMQGDEYVGAREDMIGEIGSDKKAWRKGHTQNSRPRGA